MTTSNILRHLHLPNITPFSLTESLQQTLVRQFLDHKAHLSSPCIPAPPPPSPTLLTFSPTPVYTTGRRELGTLTTTQIALLTKPMPPLRCATTQEEPVSDCEQVAEVVETLRGGQITFHGPGQLVIYPILDLKSIRSAIWPRGLTVRCYVNLLEEATIRVLAGFGIKGFRTENPGVWVGAGERKIAALGVHLRRGVASYGVGLNVQTDLRWFERIVACGLVGKQTTRVWDESWGVGDRVTGGREEIDVRRMALGCVADSWAEEFWGLVWGKEGRVERKGREDGEGIVKELLRQAKRDLEKHPHDL